MPRSAWVLGAMILAATLLSSRAARAVGEGEALLSAHLGYAHVSVEDRAGPGVLAGLEGHRGLTDAWAARLGVSGTLQPTEGGPRGPAGEAWTLGAAAGLTYALDVVRVVPFVDLGLAFMHAGGALRASRQDLGVEAGLGAEYLLGPRWALALLVRFRALPVGLGGGSSSEAPWQLCAALRLGRLL